MWEIHPEAFPQGRIVQGLGHWVLPHSKAKENLPSLLCWQLPKWGQEPAGETGALWP